MSDLREEIAREAAAAHGHDWSILSNRGECGRWYHLADRILAIPAIAEKLTMKVLPVLPIRESPPAS